MTYFDSRLTSVTIVKNILQMEFCNETDELHAYYDPL